MSVSALVRACTDSHRIENDLGCHGVQKEHTLITQDAAGATAEMATLKLMQMPLWRRLQWQTRHVEPKTDVCRLGRSRCSQTTA